MYVCIPCRETIHTEYPNCSRCGAPLVQSPYRWSPPRRNDTRAWKRIAKGEWLWDRRRVRRNPPNASYAMGIDADQVWITLPGHKPHQRKTRLRNFLPRNVGPDVDLGG